MFISYESSHTSTSYDPQCVPNYRPHSLYCECNDKLRKYCKHFVGAGGNTFTVENTFSNVVVVVMVVVKEGGGSALKYQIKIYNPKRGKIASATLNIKNNSENVKNFSVQRDTVL